MQLNWVDERKKIESNNMTRWGLNSFINGENELNEELVIYMRNESGLIYYCSVNGMSWLWINFVYDLSRKKHENY